MREALGQVERQGAVKRGGGRLVGESALAGVADEPGGGGRDAIAGSEPTPEWAAMVVEEYRSLRDGRGDEMLRRVLDLRLAGYDREEIAARLGCAVRTVTRKLDVIRQAWLEDEP